MSTFRICGIYRCNVYVIGATAHPGPKVMSITVFEGLTSRDSCRMQLQGCVCRGGMGLCMPIEVFWSSASVRAYNFVKVLACSAHRSIL